MDHYSSVISISGIGNVLFVSVFGSFIVVSIIEPERGQEEKDNGSNRSESGYCLCNILKGLVGELQLWNEIFKAVIRCNCQ